MKLSYIIIIYFVIISIIGYVLPAVDKKRAKNGEWRIPEKTLFIVSILGGSAAMLISMKHYRHKTKHKRFMIGIPCIIVLQLAAIAFILLMKYNIINI